MKKKIENRRKNAIKKTPKRTNYTVSRSNRKRTATTKLVGRKPRVSKPRTGRGKVRRHTRHLLVPHPGNQYKPHLIRWQGLTVLLALILLGQGLYNYTTGKHFDVLGRATTTTVAGLLEDTNKVREINNLPPLKLSKQLDQAAQRKAKDMFAHDYWAHVSPGGIQPWAWLAGSGYDYRVAGENLAKNYPTSEATLEAWMNSPEHRANVLNEDYEEVGFAVVNGVLQGRDTNLVVAYYAEPKNDLAVLASTGLASNVAFNEAPHQPTSLAASIGSKVQALSPASIGAISLILVAVLVSLATYRYREVLPRSLRNRWATHHGAYKAVALLLVVFILVASTNGGQI